MLKKTAQTLLILTILTFTCIAINQNTSLAATTDPAKLKIYTGPASVLADNNTYNCIFVQLQDTSSKPARALQDTTISLSSSLTNIGTINPTMIIPKGETYASASFTSTFSPGTTAISASATGYATVQASMSTIGPIPYSVAVYGFPSTLPADGGPYEAIMVQLQDSSGTPANAPKGGVFVTLSCSDSNVGTVSPSVTIAEGETYASATFTTKNQGQALVTSVAQGYTSQQVKITTTPLASTADQLKIFAGPLKIPADKSSYQQIAIELQDSQTGNAANLTSDVVVSIGSSDPSIGVIDSQIIIPWNTTFAVAMLNTTYKAGTTTLTAVATDLMRSQQVMTTTGFTPTKLAVYCSPSTLPSDKATYQSIQVQLQDSQGRPAKDPQAAVNLNLFSSQPTVGTVSSTLTIPFGQTQAAGCLAVTNTPGSTSITAQASSYTTGQATVTTNIIDFLPIEVTAAADSSSINNAQKTNITVFITADSAPVIGATVKFSSDNGGTFSATSDTGDGYYKTTFTAPSFTKTTTCTITASAEKLGYITSQATAQVTVQPPPSATPTPTPTTAATSNSGTHLSPTPTPAPNSNSNKTSAINGTTIQMRIQDYSGNPLSDTVVSSTIQPSGAKALSGITNATGYVLFRNVTVGKYTFSILKDGYEQTNTTVNFKGQAVNTTLALSSASAAAAGDSTLMIALIVVVVVIVLVISVLLLKRRRSKVNKLPPLSSFKY